MPQINQLSSISQVSGSNQIPVYDQNNGDARKMSISALLQYFQTSFAAPTVATNLFTPGTGFMDRLGRHLRFFIRRYTLV